jgi:death-on-curing protein
VTSEIDFLTVEDVMSFHEEQLHLFGGLAGVRDRAALEAAVGAPAASYNGEFLHASIFDMAAAYAYHLAQNHPFVDGNKRTALNAALVFLGLNGRDVSDPDGDLYEGMIGIAERRVSKEHFANLLERLSRQAETDAP